MKHLFVSYEVAKQLKEKGFDEPCFAHYSERSERITYTSIPLSNKNSFYVGNPHVVCSPIYQQVIDWFREKHNLHFEICTEDMVAAPVYYWNLFGKYKEGLHIRCIKNSGDGGNTGKFDSYYKALDNIIEESLKLINDGK